MKRQISEKSHYPKQIPVSGFNLVELKGGGCAWYALVKASKGIKKRWFIGNSEDAAKYLGSEWKVEAI